MSRDHVTSQKKYKYIYMFVYRWKAFFTLIPNHNRNTTWKWTCGAQIDVFLCHVTKFRYLWRQFVLHMFIFRYCFYCVSESAWKKLSNGIQHVYIWRIFFFDVVGILNVTWSRDVTEKNINIYIHVCIPLESFFHADSESQ